MAALADGRRALSESDDARLWDLETGAELARLTFDAGTMAVASSPQGGTVVVGDELGHVHVIDLIE